MLAGSEGNRGDNGGGAKATDYMNERRFEVRKIRIEYDARLET